MTLTCNPLGGHFNTARFTIQQNSVAVVLGRGLQVDRVMEPTATNADDPETREADAAMDSYARDGDPKAFSKLIDVLQPRLLRYVRRHLRNDANAEDVVQLCFLRLHENRGKFCVGASVVPYAFAITRRLLIDKIRSERRERGRETALMTLPPPDSVSPDQVLARQRAVARLQLALSEIPAHHREAFELTMLDGLSLEDAAAVTDSTPTALKMRKHYARIALRERLGEDLEALL